MKVEENAAMPLAGGIMQHGYQCGMIWGATLAAGAQAFKLLGPGPLAEAKAIMAAQKLVESFRDSKHEINCSEITHTDKSSSNMQMIMYFLIKGGTIGCLRMAGKYAPAAYNDINSVLSENNTEVPSPPVSCTAILAEKMNLSEKHKTMIAGFAGGIGLCGGACGALGAAIWILTMNDSKDAKPKLEFNSPEALQLIEKFLKVSDYEFECSEIVGRKFESINDHADYIQKGGCSKIIDALASA